MSFDDTPMDAWERAREDRWERDQETGVADVRDDAIYGGRDDDDEDEPSPVRATLYEVAEDYKCDLCGAQSLLKTCLDCLKHPAIDHPGRDAWDKNAGVDAW